MHGFRLRNYRRPPFSFSGRRPTGRVTRARGVEGPERIPGTCTLVDIYALLLNVVVALSLPNGRIRVANSPSACSIQDAASELPRILIPRTPVNKNEEVPFLDREAEPAYHVLIICPSRPGGSGSHDKTTRT